MHFKPIVFFFCFLLLSACTSSTRSVVNTIENQKPQVSPSIAQAKQKHLKRVVAIGRFSDETKRGNSFWIDSNNNRIGKQASDILSSRLTESGKFMMLERTDIDILNSETNLNGEQLSVVGADFIILGSVSEYGRSTTSDVGIFSRNKKQTATVTVNVRLVNTKTSQVVYSEEATGEAIIEANAVFGVGEKAGYDSSLDDKALSAAISKLVSNIMENLLDAPWQAYILSSQDSQYLMSGGQEQGIKLGDKFQVLSKGKRIKNPQTGGFVELPGKQIATIKIVGFVGTGSNALSVASLESGAIGIANLKDYVVREL